MALFVIPPTPIVVEVDTRTSPRDRVVRTLANPHLGNGLLRPFRRDLKNDFANADGLALVKACVGQVLGTRAATEKAEGEVPWNTEFGSRLYRLRHMRNDTVLSELGRVYVVDALKLWEPRVVVKGVVVSRDTTVARDLNILSIRLKYDVIARNVPGNEVLFADVDQTVRA